jgi:hypothetical protein
MKHYATGADAEFTRDQVDHRHPVDFIEPELNREQLLSHVAEMFGSVLHWASQAKSLVQMGQRMYVMLYVLRPALIEGMTLANIGKQNAVTRQAVDKLITDFRLTFGVTGRTMRSDETRRRCRASQLNRARKQCSALERKNKEAK